MKFNNGYSQENVKTYKMYSLFPGALMIFIHMNDLGLTLIMAILADES